MPSLVFFPSQHLPVGAFCERVAFYCFSVIREFCELLYCSGNWKQAAGNKKATLSDGFSISNSSTPIPLLLSL
jgi:hypothetical protein